MVGDIITSRNCPTPAAAPAIQLVNAHFETQARALGYDGVAGQRAMDIAREVGSRARAASSNGKTPAPNQ